MSESETGKAGPGPDPSGRGGPPTGGEASTEGVVAPPYEGRTTKDASADPSGEPEERQQRAAGVQPGSRTESLTDPDQTPGGRTTTPADEQPAGEVEVTRDSDPGVGPAHYAGTTRAEDAGEAPHESEEAGRETTGVNEVGRPIGESSARDATTIDPQEGPT